MKTAQEKIDWLKENGVPNETMFRAEHDRRVWIFMGIKKASKAPYLILAYERDNENMANSFDGTHIEIITPPKKTRKLYLWDYSHTGSLARTMAFFCDNNLTINNSPSALLKESKWKRKVESSIIEVDEDGNICGGEE